MSTATKADLARAGTMELTAKVKVKDKCCVCIMLTSGRRRIFGKKLDHLEETLLMNHFDEKDSGESSSTSKIAKHTTMAGTAEEAKALLDGEVLGDTRQETKKKKQSLAKNSPKTNVASTKRTSTIDKALEEAKAVYNDLDTSGEGRSLRKRSSSSSPKKSPAVKRAGTMLKTAEEGKEFVKRGGKKASAKKGKKAAAASGSDADD